LDDGTTTLSATEINVLDGITAGTASGNKALIVDTNKDISSLRNITASGTVTASDFTGSFSGDGTGITGVSATELGILMGETPLIFEGPVADPHETKIAVTNPTADRVLTLPDVSGTFLTTGNKTAIDTVGTVTDGVWQGAAVADTYVADDLTISGGIINGTVIGAVTPATGGFTSVTASGAVTGGSITDGTATLTSGALSGATAVTASGLVTAGSLDIDNVQIDGTTIVTRMTQIY
jgi:hypothetical protein